MRALRICGYVLLVGNILGLVLLFLNGVRTAWVLLFSGLVILLTVYLILQELMVFKPLGRLKARLREDPEKTDREQNLGEGLRNHYFREIRQDIESYAALRIRRNNAEIFNKQTELTALQSQINPHFLYNTLDTIRGQAMFRDDTEVAEMIETLAAFFRYSISRKGNMVTLRDELNNINNYMRIQQYRFRNRFSLEILVDEEDTAAYDFYVPRLILQPIVENAVVHGLEDKMEGAKITIEVAVMDDLILTVSDNGKGMSLEELDNLNERICSGDMKLECEGESGKKSTGIALPNINKRIGLLYGKKYGLHVYSSVGCGTDVELILPANDYAEEAGIEKNSTEG